jgi:hypothetical protein
VSEVHAGVGLERRLVLREPGVAVDAEHRAAVAPRVGAQVRADLLQPVAHVLDERQRRIEHV